jgi:hypothetical protein
MIKRYNCSQCSASFDKYLALFEDLDIVECAECYGAAHLELEAGSASLLTTLENELFLFKPEEVLAN